MDVNALPEIVERKRTLTGGEKTFACRVLDRTPGAITVLFVSGRTYQVGARAGGPAGLTLPAGTITFGHFWSARPYNVYHWLTPTGATLAHYFNLVDGTSLTETTLAYRDLTVDVLVRPGAAPEVLDEDELPPDLDGETHAVIAAARAEVLGAAPAVIAALEATADRLWRDHFGGARR